MKINSRLSGAAFLVASLLMTSGAAFAGTATVGATKDIWLAGQASGASVSGFFGADTAPANAPLKFLLTALTLTFAATGSTSVDGSCFAGASGAGCYNDESSFSPAPWSGLYKGPADALVGIFLDASTPALADVGGYTGPTTFVAGPDYTQSSNVGPGAYAPALNQIFLIGDGSGETFTAPTGATRLFLGVADSIGGSAGNVGALSVNFTGAVAAVPEPATWAMMLLGLFGLGAALRGSRRKGVAAAA